MSSSSRVANRVCKGALPACRPKTVGLPIPKAVLESRPASSKAIATSACRTGWCARALSLSALRRRDSLNNRTLRHYSEQAPPRAEACPTCTAPLPASPTEQVTSHCPACNAFLPPSEDVDYFELFSLPSSFTVDRGQLRRQFLQWQGLVHPDRLPQTKDNRKRRQQEDWANMWSAIVNEGYKTLSEDRLRGEYMLGKHGVAIQEEDKMDDPELLMEILEVREALEDAKTEEEVDEIRSNNRELTKQTVAELEELLSSDIDQDKAKNLLIRLRYMNNVENVCKEWQPGKEIVLQH